MSTVSEGQFKDGDASFYSKTWTVSKARQAANSFLCEVATLIYSQPSIPLKAKLIFVHGFSEHINRYNDFFPRLAEKGIQVFGWDQRGWGRSVTKPAQKGLTGPTSQVVADIAAFVKDKLPAKDDASAVPVFIMGHSMGGGEILTLAGDSRYAELVGQIRGWILECPFVGFPIGEEPSSVKILAGRLIGRLLPKQQLKHVVPPEYLSRDEAIVQSVRDDPLCHDTGTLEGLASLLDRTTILSSGRVQLGKHVQGLLLTHGTKDRACSYDAAVKFIDQQNNVQDKTTKTYDGAYHQLHADHCKDEFTKDVVEWILERCSQPAAAPESLESKL
jgi:acylglycerol lipase